MRADEELGVSNLPVAIHAPAYGVPKGLVRVSGNRKSRHRTIRHPSHCFVAEGLNQAFAECDNGVCLDRLMQHLWGNTFTQRRPVNLDAKLLWDEFRIAIEVGGGRIRHGILRGEDLSKKPRFQRFHLRAIPMAGSTEKHPVL